MDYKINDVLKTSDYNFLRSAPYKDDLILLTLSGSISYGTNIVGSDIDIRGIALNNKSQLLGFDKIEQYADDNTDTTIFTLAKIFELLIDCNPNSLELLFTKEDHRVYNELGKLLIDNRKLFLSQLVVFAYNGYINAQIHRVKNAMRKDGGMSLEDELIYERARLEDLIVHFNHTRAQFDKSSMGFLIKDNKILMNCNLVEYPAGDLSSIFSELTNVLKSWNKSKKLAQRELDSKKLCKFCLHILRLLSQEYDLLTKGDFSTFIEDKQKLKEMMDTRNGFFMDSDGTMNDAYFDLVNKYQKDIEYAKANCVLPRTCDMDKVEDLFKYLNEKAISKDYTLLNF